MEAISRTIRDHYAGKFAEYGPTPAGVDWIREETANISYHYSLKAIRPEHRQNRVQILDVGCGYGGLIDYAKLHGIELDYTGIDIVPEMVENGRVLHPEARFIIGDFLQADLPQRYDYVVCNGALTIKLKTSTLEMHHYVDAMARKLYATCNVGMGFNVMTSRVNFQAENSYYRSPVETLSFCFSELSNRVIIDHDHPRFQFWTYVYRE